MASFPSCFAANPLPATEAAAMQEPGVNQWFAACVRSRHEKSVAQHLERNRVECFVPLYEEVRRWKDRRMTLRLPLFAGYVFAHICPGDRMRVLTAPGVVRLVTFQGQPAAIPDPQIESLRALSASEARMRPHPYLAVGRRVRVSNGPFAGAEGILLRSKGRLRFVLSLELLARSVALEVDSSDVSPVSQR